MTLKILAIDDSRTIREMLRMALSGAGFDGFGVIEAIRGGPTLNTLPILVLTTESAQDLKDRARNAGATGWIVKPFDDAKLISAIRRIAAV
jgi:two-component system chemotaxis response regulator CheY